MDTDRYYIDCDNFFEGFATNVDASECDEECSGNSQEDCGAANRLSVYFSGVPAIIPTQVPAPVTSTTLSLGCFK